MAKQEAKNKVQEILKGLQKNKKFSDLQTMDATSSVNEWISTGSYVLNKIISGDYRKGLPVGKITALAGEPSVGKSFICGKVIAEAQKAGFIVILIDTENSYTPEFIKNLGGDPEEIIPVPCATTTDVKNQFIPLLRQLHTDNPDEKFLVILDSLAGLATEKQLGGDIDDGKVGHDQGMKAKDLKLLATVLMHEIPKNNATLLVTNHIYLKPGQNPSIPPEHVFTGGNGFIYACSTIVYLYKKQEKTEEKEGFSGKNVKKPNGMFIRGKTVKNRFIAEGIQGEMYVNFVKGMNKWYGLGEDASEFGYIKKNGGWVEIAHLEGKKIREGQLYKDEIWNPIFEELSQKVVDKLKFKPVQDIEGVDCDEVENTENDESEEED
jgi:RecA/RadA recombinase